VPSNQRDKGLRRVILTAVARRKTASAYANEKLPFRRIDPREILRGALDCLFGRMSAIA